MLKTKTENAKSSLAFWFPLRISFKIMRESAIAGKSGLGDWTKSRKISETKSKLQAFFQKYRADKSPEKQRLFLEEHPKY